MQACISGHKDVVKHFLDHSGIKDNAADNDGGLHGLDMKDTTMSLNIY